MEQYLFTMIFKKYLIQLIAIGILFPGLFIVFNYIQDDFGLFRDPTLGKRIWYHEKTSKFLLSYRYIGENFDGVIVGSSVSANLNPNLLANYKLYNLSMTGGNISEIKWALDILFENNQLQYLVICLYPYMTKNSGRKGKQIQAKEYWGSLFSVLPVRILVEKIWCFIGVQGVFHESTSGFNDFNMFKKSINFKKVVLAKIKGEKINIHTDPVALQELSIIVKKAHHNGVKILAYFYPVYSGIFLRFNPDSWAEYKKSMENVFDTEDVLWDMNSKEYNYINNNIENYSDGHLSDQGAFLVLKSIGNKLNKVIGSSSSGTVE